MDLSEAIHMAVKYANQGMFDQAMKTCRDIIAANDRYHPAFHLLGQISFQNGRLDVAAQMLQRAAQLDENRATYQRDFGEILFYIGKPKDALMAAGRAVKLNANDAKSHYITAMALMALGEHSRAIEALQATIKLQPNHSPAYNNLGSLLEAGGEPQKAKNAYLKAIEINEANVEAQNNLGSILIAQGDTEAAQKHFEAAIKTRPAYIEAHHNLSALKRYKKDDVHIKILEEITRDPAKLTLENQVRLYFILGKASSDIGDYDRAFKYYRSANDKKRASFKYDEQADVNFTDHIKSTFNKSYFKINIKSKADDPTPIFIVGMPRSGSTLIEQILVSHSQIHGGGELVTLGEIIKEEIKDFPRDIEKLSDNKLKAIGQKYLDNVKKLAPDAKCIVDKMPGNYQFVGLIAKILPGAHMINSNRNAMDSCLSIYSRLFLQTIYYGYDLGELGRYYNRYQGLMDHWHNILPKDILIDVNYEDVVNNLEQQARKIIDFVGLDWQDECLEFYKNKAQVNTASAAQVRQPIYKSSIERWRSYEKNLDPLIEALGNSAPDLSA